MARLCETRDAALLAQLHQACFSNAWDKKSCEELLANKHCRAWVIEKEKPLGFLMAHIIDSEAEILTTCIHPSAQRQGLATILISGLFEQWKNASIARVFLDVSAQNKPAIELYTKLSFATKTIRKNYYSIDGSDALVMAKDL